MQMGSNSGTSTRNICLPKCLAQGFDLDALQTRPTLPDQDSQREAILVIPTQAL